MNRVTQIHVVETTRNGETFLVRFRDDQRADALRALARWASDPELPAFNWFTAATLSCRIRKLETEFSK